MDRQTKRMFRQLGMVGWEDAESERVQFRCSWDTPIHRPHYSDERFSRGKEHTLYGAEQKGLSYDYSDRLWQWDYTKAKNASKAATEAGLTAGSPHWYEHYLSTYFGKPVKLVHIIGGVNVSNGYEYFAFGYKGEE